MNAQFNLGRCFEHGLGTHRNLWEASRLFAAAAS
jgi:TPR repeat protein